MAEAVGYLEDGIDVAVFEVGECRGVVGIEVVEAQVLGGLDMRGDAARHVGAVGIDNAHAHALDIHVGYPGQYEDDGEGKAHYQLGEEGVAAKLPQLFNNQGS